MRLRHVLASHGRCEVSPARFHRAVHWVAASLALAAIPAQAETGGRLLHLGERLDRVAERAGAESAYRAALDLRALEIAQRLELELELPGGRFAAVQRTRLDRRAGGDLLWTGRTGRGLKMASTSGCAPTAAGSSVSPRPGRTREDFSSTASSPEPRTLFASRRSTSTGTSRYSNERSVTLPWERRDTGLRARSGARGQTSQGDHTLTSRRRAKSNRGGSSRALSSPTQSSRVLTVSSASAGCSGHET